MTQRFGPGILVAAAFIGPGTVTACTLAGKQFGYALVWALVFATCATLILQDMAARLGVAARLGLGEALMQALPSRALRWGSGALVFAALMIGNCAYEGGNLAGGALGLSALIEGAPLSQGVWVAVLAMFAAGVILFGRYRLLERLLIALVMMMSLAFIGSVFAVRPDIGAFFAGLRPSIPQGGMLTAIALIGTTIVPYNLFLHAATARQKWSTGHSVSEARQDSALAIGLGGLVSLLILSTAAASLFESQLEIAHAGDMARAIEPAYGPLARYLVGLGLFAAGLTSAITAPMATAYALNELSGQKDVTGLRFRAIALCVIAVGALISLSGLRPVSLILIAQYTNGLLLPLIAAFLLYVMNKRSLLGVYTNGLGANLLGGAVVLITLGLGLRSILRAAGVMI